MLFLRHTKANLRRSIPSLVRHARGKFREYIPPPINDEPMTRRWLSGFKFSDFHAYEQGAKQLPRRSPREPLGEFKKDVFAISRPSSNP